MPERFSASDGRAGAGRWRHHDLVSVNACAYENAGAALRPAHFQCQRESRPVTCWLTDGQDLLVPGAMLRSWMAKGAGVSSELMQRSRGTGAVARKLKSAGNPDRGQIGLHVDHQLARLAGHAIACRA